MKHCALLGRKTKDERQKMFIIREFVVFLLRLKG